MNKLRVRTSILLILFLFTLVRLCYSQPGSNLVSNFKVLNPFDKNVPGPDASLLTMSLENPVGLYTGSIALSLPLYEIEIHDFRLNIALNYSNNGIHVNQLSSNVGLGWSLKAGGVITRTVRGKRDEINYNGYTSTSVTKLYNYLLDEEINNDNEFNYLLYLAEGLMDGEPDLYYFNFGSYSGMFLFDKNNNIQFIPEQNFKVEVIRAGNSNIGQSNHINTFIITSEDGTKYTFGSNISHRDKFIQEYLGLYLNREKIYNNISNPLARKYLANNATPAFHQEHYTSWYLSQISFPTNNEVITFNYASDLIYTYIGTVEHYMAGQGGLSNNVFDPNDPFVLQRTNTHRLSSNSRITSISWSKGRIDFIPNENPREDINDESDKKGYAISNMSPLRKVGWTILQ